MGPQPGGRFYRVLFDELAFGEDLGHSTIAARRVARHARARMERDGIAASELRPCQPEGRDGTRLGNCVKTYLPDGAGPWRMVFEVVRPGADRELVLAYRAFGLGHPEKPWQPSVYQVADQRLHNQA